MLFVSEKEVLELLNWDDTYKATETALKKISLGDVVLNARSVTQISNRKKLLSMPGFLKDDVFGALACKLVTSFPDNAYLETPLATANGSILLFDENTGILKAVVAGSEITKWRTSAASVVATKHMMKAGKSYNVLAVLGCGEQGRTHVEAFFYFFKFAQIRLWNRTVQKAENLAKELNKKYSTTIFVAFSNNEDCVKGADVIVTCTYSESPIVKYNWVKPGAHINAVGLGKFHYNELEGKIYMTSEVVVDHRENIKAELSGLVELGVTFKGEIGSIISGDISLDNRTDKTTVFQNNGVAIEDCAMARLIFDAYMNKNKAKL